MYIIPYVEHWYLSMHLCHHFIYLSIYLTGLTDGFISKYISSFHFHLKLKLLCSTWRNQIIYIILEILITNIAIQLKSKFWKKFCIWYSLRWTGRPPKKNYFLILLSKSLKAKFKYVYRSKVNVKFCTGYPSSIPVLLPRLINLRRQYTFIFFNGFTEYLKGHFKGLLDQDKIQLHFRSIIIIVRHL